MDVAKTVLIRRANRLLRRAERARRRKLERELAGYASAADRHELQALLERSPDGDGHEIQTIITQQAAARRRPPGCGMGYPGGRGRR